MKTSMLFLALCLPVYLFAQLNGDYTIGGNNPDFITISAAAAALQTQGEDGPVNLLIRDGVYEEQVQLNGIPGASAFNPVVFQGESQDSSAVIWEWPDASIIDNYVFYGENLSFLYFKHLTMRRPTTGNNGRIVVVLGYADGVFFENCALIGSTGANNFQEDLVLASYCPLIDFKQCRFENGFEGISSAGQFNGPFEGAIHVDQCTFVNQKEAGVFGIYIDHVWVTNSTFLSQNINGNVGILIEDTDNASILTGNYFYFDNTILSGNTAIEMDGQIPTPNASLIANNMIAMFGGNGSSSGIRLLGIEAANVYFNTVRIRKTPGYQCYAALVDNCVAVNLLNNNFVAEGSPTIGYFQEGVQFNDYNNFYTEPGVNWLANLTTGAHCHSVDPGFLDDTDLHVSISD
ncbi:MAG: hypothetical protein KDC44_24590, partial [Phaeodactylibacter sp.]|nr:hypothetical protein [Phaeodactylibacter sp.]